MHSELFMNGESEQSGVLSENIKWCVHAERTEKWESGTFGDCIAIEHRLTLISCFAFS